MPPIDPTQVLPTGRDFDAKPYSADEQRVANWLVERGGIGGGDDPIGFLMGSLTLAMIDRNRYLETLLDIAQMPSSNPSVYQAVRKATGRD